MRKSILLLHKFLLNLSQAYLLTLDNSTVSVAILFSQSTGNAWSMCMYFKDPFAITLGVRTYEYRLEILALSKVCQIPFKSI